ncbi:hypothetical protein JTE90_005769 [Oedothorax gibbosus]|uniref:BPTI/Kunitz inhibitor domain-containing protein n=1 Tax=Oedothorax gibbosus TaxID=931172 RepID=A0AAV6UTN5_9ARAC|nr:hypothetical protein JTE90_005769 [Oedothorax gibbosus]
MSSLGVYSFLSSNCALLSTFLFILRVTFTTAQTYPGYPQRLGGYLNPVDLHPRIVYPNRTSLIREGPTVPDFGPWVRPCRTTVRGVRGPRAATARELAGAGSHTRTEYDCPPPLKDFRAEQCARFNSVPYKGSYYSWLPYYGAQNPCELNCLPHVGSFYAKLDKRVIDGTRCKDDGSRDMCVDGECMSVGCDNILGSTNREDECGVCGGDGSSCQIVKGLFEDDNFEVGYNDILLIPVGSTSILIKEVSPTNNFLAIRNSIGVFYLNGNWRIDYPREIKISRFLSANSAFNYIITFCAAIRNSIGVFYLNGNWRIDYPREIKVAGTIFHYERKHQGRLQPDTLRAKGPTVEPIYIVLLYQERNLGISYEYSIPATSKSRLPDSYSWTSGDFEECSQTCGGGVQYRPVRCVRNSDKDIVDEELCDLSAKPSVNASCNTEPCPSGWQIGEWSECSESCGGGTQFRLVFCHQSVGGAVGLIPDEQCEQPKPVFMRACNVDKECPDWLAGEWSECDRECGTGNQTRTVECRSGGSGGEVHEETLCSADQKPADNQLCNLGPCEGVEWIVSEWSGCDGSCSPHLQSRSVHCANEDGLVFPDDECEAAKKPELTKECPTSPMCEPMWHASQWSECSVNCGKGVQSRIVFCGVWQENETVMKIEDDKCEVDKKFESVQNCSAESCEGVWFTGPWNRCSVPCGGGERVRKILCFHENEVVDADSCSASERPDDKETCNMTPCDEDEIMEIGGCKDSKYGCCPDGVTRAGPNDEGCPKMDIVSANTTCEEAEYGCCEDNFTLALGPFKKGCPITVSCNSSKHGCCPDLETPASGPDMEGCPEIESCFNSTFGCCPDNVTFANSFELDGCEETPCENTTYGCCSDGLTAASGPNYEGCDNATTAFPTEIEGSGENCYDLKFGCCPDGMTPAEGVNQTGCEDAGNTTDCKTSAFGCCEDDITFAEEDCSNSFYGCCPDNVTSATGLNEEGCFPEDCTNSTFGCCPDNVTAAFGFDNEGCFPEDCSNSTFGCCPDNVTAALGIDNDGCFPEDCSNSTFGCCPDNVTAASGYDGEGCEVGNCSNYLFGCCPDNVTEAQGPDGEGCEPIDCSNTTFGCCPDNSTIAKGPDYQGCIYDDCSNTTYGCCSDNKTVSGPSFEGCDDTITLVDCGNTTFGCCPDNTTAASGPDFEGCENATDCSSTEFGCCPNNITVAVGMDFEGCNETETTTVVTEPLTTTVPPDCVGSTFGCCPDEVTEALGRNLEGCCFGMRFGCCPDNKTAALGPTFLGCGCQTYPYGCCPDGITPSQGFNFHGCKCEHFRYGCCQDKFTPATGPNFEGCVCQLMQYGCCPDGRTPRTSENDDDCGCESTRFGCCPDGRTPAQGADMSGCTCDSLPYGCCPNGFTPARTPDLRDCPCETQRYGCCLDGRTMARGPNYEGCPCDSTRFGCCPDGRTVAQGPNMYDCPCETLPYGCCADGYTPARGQRYEGCPDVRQPKPEVSTEVCSFPKDSGPCRNFTVKWFFDIAYGGCSRFWYGGCDGNGNKFDTTEDCENVCVKPEGPEACFLPKTIGSCNDKIPSWYYDVGSESCEAFTYGGCLGNNNRFVSKEACEQKCINLQPTSVDKCDLPKDEGSCDGAVIQWYYNKQNTRCEQFYYGGCKGNANRFDTRRECESSCLANVVEERDVCRLPQNPGTCSEFRERWFFDYEMGQCHRFLYSGCDGNDNNFGSFGECEQRCGKKTDPQPPPPEMEFRTETT